MSEERETAGVAGDSRRAAADFETSVRRADRLGILVVSLPKWIAFAFIAWQARISIEVMAAPYGTASLLARLGRQASYWEVVCWIAGTLGLLFGLYSRHLLQRLLKLQLSRLDSIEKQLNLIPDTGSPADAGPVIQEKL